MKHRIPIRYVYNHARREFTIPAAVLLQMLQDARDLGKSEQGKDKSEQGKGR